jgi:hypothetical protein
MEEAATLMKISEDLDFLKREVMEIRTHMVDVDCLLTTEEAKELDASIANYKNRKTTSLAQLKKDLGL